MVSSTPPARNGASTLGPASNVIEPKEGRHNIYILCGLFPLHYALYSFEGNYHELWHTTKTKVPAMV
ncbi:hypothetical protein BaRGS_00021759, partial [Batillaria attramentaria]